MLHLAEKCNEQREIGEEMRREEEKEEDENEERGREEKKRRMNGPEARVKMKTNVH